MIFWTLVALVAAATIFNVWRSINDDYNEFFDHIMYGAASVFIGGIIGGILFLLCAWLIPWNQAVVSDNTYKLKAIGNSSALEGRTFFLGGGYINDKRVLNFISQRDGGAIHVEQAEAEDSTIYEGSKDATVRIQHIDASNGWIATWPLGSGDEYEFRIPTGSVVEPYTLDNK
jgi:hypothetical protein